MKIEDFIGQRGACFEQDRNESSVPARIVEAGKVLRGRRRALTSELQETVLVDELAEFGAQFEIANVL